MAVVGLDLPLFQVDPKVCKGSVAAVLCIISLLYFHNVIVNSRCTVVLSFSVNVLNNL